MYDINNSDLKDTDLASLRIFGTHITTVIIRVLHMSAIAGLRLQIFHRREVVSIFKTLCKKPRFHYSPQYPFAIVFTFLEHAFKV